MDQLLALVPRKEQVAVELWPYLELLVVRHVLGRLLSRGPLPSYFLGEAMDRSVRLVLDLQGD